MNIIKIFVFILLIHFLFFLAMMLTSNKGHAASVGYLGCSLTEDAVKGALRQGNTELWPLESYLSGGSLGDITHGDKFGNLNSFYGMFWNYPVDTVWLQVCAGLDIEYETYDYALSILDAIRATGATTIYVSAPPKYTNPRSNYCGYAGPNGQARVESIVSQLIANGEALAGPTVGPLDVQRHTRDKCHGNQAGQNLMGSQLIKFGW